MIAGLLIARRRMLSGWARWITLATGGYVFVTLFPAGFWAECGRTAGNRWLDARLGGHWLGRRPGRVERRVVLALACAIRTDP